MYHHRGKRWLAPRRLIRYDGAPEDLLAVVALSVPGILAFEGTVRTALLGGVVVSVVYTLLRKRLPDIGASLCGR